MALGAFQGADKSLDAQKRALLSAVAERGQAGQAAFEAQQKAAQAMRADAVRGVAKDMGLHQPPAALAGQLSATAGGPGDVYAAEAATQGAAFQSGIAQIGAANGAYMDQVAAARPVVESVTERQVAQIRAELQAKKDAAAAEAAAAEREQRFAEEEHAWAGREHEWRMGEARAASADPNGDGKKDLVPKDRRAVEHETGLSLDDQMAIEQNTSYQSLAATMTEAFQNGYSAGETKVLLEREAKRLAEESGVAGYGTTLKYLWSQAADNWGDEGKWVSASLAQPAAPAAPTASRSGRAGGGHTRSRGGRSR